jgi:sugar transferase (PEP-CTERM system associated)
MIRIFRRFYPIRNLFFVLGEGILIYLSILMASHLLMRHEIGGTDYELLLRILLITIVCQVSIYCMNLYELNLSNSILQITVRIIQALGLTSIVLAIIFWLFPKTVISSGIFILSISAALILVTSWRYAYRILLVKGFFNQRMILLGSGELAKNIETEIHRKPDCGFTISLSVPEFGRDNELPSPPPENSILRNGYEGLCEMAGELGIHKIIVALEDKRGKLPIKELLKCRVSGIDVLEGVSFYEMITGKLIVESINPGWLIFSKGFEKSFLKKCVKRLMDLVCATVISIILAPVILLTALAIKLESKGPIFYHQERVGKNRKPYTMHKFRSMVVDAEINSGPVWAMKNDDRITRTGRIIRKVRIDEIPQLWNVIKGNMSLVGPRPERDSFVKELEKRIPYYSERFTVKPGISGWAQINYGYGESIEDAIEKLNYDLYYIKNMSGFMDVVIIFRTIKTVFFDLTGR